MAKKKNPARQAGVTKGGSAGKYIKYENRIRKMTARQLDAEQAKMRDSIDEEKLKILEMELYMRRAWNPKRRKGVAALGYDSRASNRVNMSNLAKKRIGLEEELRVTRDAKARAMIQGAIRRTVEVEQRLSRAEAARPERPARTRLKKVLSAAAKRRAKREEQFMRRFESNPGPGLADLAIGAMPGGRSGGWPEAASMAAAEEKEADSRIRQWLRSKSRSHPDFVSLMEAYDAARMSNFYHQLNGDEDGRARMRDALRHLREEILVVLELRGKSAIPKHEDEPIDAEFEEAGRKKKRVGNPTSMRHLKAGRAALKKSEKAWDSYYKRGSKKSLLEAYEAMLLAKTELKYGGDTAGARQANVGLKLARAELKA